MHKLIEHARTFATSAHERIGHQRKYNNQPYQVHLRAVANLVASVTDDAEMIAAAWLHDTVEDTSATLDDIAETSALQSLNWWNHLPMSVCPVMVIVPFVNR